MWCWLVSAAPRSKTEGMLDNKIVEKLNGMDHSENRNSNQILITILSELMQMHKTCE